jgi:hypothetical protein
MNWNLEGKKVTGLYLNMFSIKGVITESRVKYGGKVSNTILLDNPIIVFGAEREVVLMDSEELTVV